MGDVGRAAEHDFNHHYLEILRSLHKRFVSKDSSSEAFLRLRKLKRRQTSWKRWITVFVTQASTRKKHAHLPSTLLIGFLSKSFLAKVLSPPKGCVKLYQKCCELARNTQDEKKLADSLNSSGFCCLDDAPHCQGHDATRACEMFQEAYNIRKGLPEKMQKCETHGHVTTKLGLCVLLQVSLLEGCTISPIFPHPLIDYLL